MSVSNRYFSLLQRAMASFPHAEFERLLNEFRRARDEGRTIFVMGNGGSAATASHWVCGINKCCSVPGLKRFKMVCLNDNVPMMLALANDCGYESVFVEQLKNFCAPRDVVVGISGSGNSKNVVAAFEYARSVGAVTVGLTGYSGGRLRTLSDISIWIPADDMQVTEDLHGMALHMTMKGLSEWQARTGAEARKPVVGINLDNTIVCYDRSFHRIAVERGLIGECITPTTEAVKEAVVSRWGEAKWTELQGLVYGTRILEAEPFPGVIETLSWLKGQGIPVVIVSQKPKAAHAGAPVNLHDAARRWLVERKAAEPNCPNVFFEETTEAKTSTIRRLGCEIFIDHAAAEGDLPEVDKVLFAGAASTRKDAGLRTWTEVRAYLERRCGPSSSS